MATKAELKKQINALASEHLGFQMTFSSSKTKEELEKRLEAYTRMIQLDREARQILSSFDNTTIQVAAIFPDQVPAEQRAEIERAWALQKQATEIWQSN